MTKTIAKRTKELTTWEKACKDFSDSLTDGARNFATSYVAHLDAGFTKDELHLSLPMMTNHVWSRLELIGRGEMAAELLWYQGPSRVQKLKERELKRAKATGGVDVLTGDGQSVRRVPLESLSSSEALLAIGHDGSIRTEREQRSVWLKEKKKNETAQRLRIEKKQEQGWKLYDDGRCMINGVMFSKHQMLSLFRDWQDVVF